MRIWNKEKSVMGQHCGQFEDQNREIVSQRDTWMTGGWESNGLGVRLGEQLSMSSAITGGFTALDGREVTYR